MLCPCLLPPTRSNHHLLLLLPTMQWWSFAPTDMFFPIFHHLDERRHLRPYCEKLTSHSCMRTNISASSSSLPHGAPWGHKRHFYHSSTCTSHLCGTIGHISRQWPSYVWSTTRTSLHYSPFFQFSSVANMVCMSMSKLGASCT